MKAASSSRHSSTISWSYRSGWSTLLRDGSIAQESPAWKTNHTDQTEGDAVSRAGSSRFDDVASFTPSCTSTWQDNYCQLNSAEQLNCTRAPLLQAIGLFPIVWAHVSKWGVAYLRGNLLFIPPHRTVQDLYSVGRQRLGRQKGGKDLVERWVNANERWQSAARTDTWTV